MGLDLRHALRDKPIQVDSAGIDLGPGGNVDRHEAQGGLAASAQEASSLISPRPGKRKTSGGSVVPS